MIGLLCFAPKGATPAEALERTQNFSIHDLIYSWLPVNYKVFHKPLPFGCEFYRDMANLLCESYQDMTKLFLSYNPFLTANTKNNFQRFISDGFSLMVNMFLPFQLTYFSKGMCANVPFIEDIIDFETLNELNKSRKPEFYLNAYNIDEKKMVCFPDVREEGQEEKEAITPDHFRAAMAFPFIYPPVKIKGKYYYEGAAHDCLNYTGLLYNDPPAGNDEPAMWIDKLRPIFKTPGRKEIIVLDVMSADELIHVPRTLWDAYNVSIITPLVEIARDDTKLFEYMYLPKINAEFKRHGQDTEIVLRKLDFRKLMNDELWANSLDWEYSNSANLFELGKKTAEQFCEDC